MAIKPTLKTLSVKDVAISEALIFPTEAGYSVTCVLIARDAAGAVLQEKRVRIDLDAEGNGYAQQLLTNLQALAVSLL